MEILTTRQQITYTCLLFCLLLALAPRVGCEFDVGLWVQWATYIFEHGLGNVYQQVNNDYPPFYHYILWVYGQGVGSVEKIEHYTQYLKGYTLVFDFVGAFWAASLVPERSRRFGLALLLLLNIGYLYNTVIWGQVDSIYTFFCFGAVVLAARRRPVLSALCYTLALLSKVQAIIFLPPLLLLWAPQWWHRPRQLVAAGLAAGALALLVLAPFIWGGWENYLPRVGSVYFESVGKLPRVGMNAFNIWYLLLPSVDPVSISDTLPFGGLTYRSWGLIWFFMASVLALLPLLVAAWQALRERSNAGPVLPLVLLSCGAVPLLFCFFNTQMHERYWHAALLFLAAYGFVRRDYLPYVLGSVAYCLQLEKVLRFWGLLNYDVLVFNQQFIAVLFGLLIALLLVKLYRLAPWRAAPSAAVAPVRASSVLAAG